MATDDPERSAGAPEPLQGAVPQWTRNPAQMDPHPQAFDGGVAGQPVSHLTARGSTGSPPVPRPPAVLHGGAPTITVTRTARLLVRASWSSSTGDDLSALVVLRDGTVVTVDGSGPQGLPPSELPTDRQGVRPTDDARPDVVDVVEVALSGEVTAVVPVVRSPEPEGTGSSAQHRVILEVDNGRGEAVRVCTEGASDRVLSCVPVVIHVHARHVEVERVWLCSEPGSAGRPAVHLVDGRVQVTMDPSQSGRTT